MRRSSASQVLVRQLDDSRSRFQAILRLSPVGIAVTRLSDGRLVEFNEAFLRIIGYPRTAVEGKSSADLSIWASATERTEAFARLAAGQDIVEMPSRIRRGDGALRDVRFSATVIRLDDEPHMVGSLRDVTEELALHRASDEAARRFRSLAESVPVVIAYWDREQRNRFGNTAFVPWFGIDPARMEGMHLREVIGEALYQLNQPHVDAVLRGEHQIYERTVALAENGDLRQALVELVPDVVDGQVVGFFSQVFDVTQTRIAEKALVESERRYRNVIEDQTELISRFRVDGTMVFVNEVFCRFFGKREEELVGHSWHPVAHPDDVDMINARLALITPEHPVVVIENRVYAADGTEHWMQFVNRGLFDADGCLREIQSVGRDISARKRAEAALAASRAELHALLESVDRAREEQRREIAREIHDQLGAGLTAVSFHLEALKREVGDQPTLVRELELMRDRVTEVSQAARDLCSRLRPSILDDLGLVSACRWYVGEWSDLTGIPVRYRLAPLKAEPSDALRTDLFRVLQELLTNVARHAGARRVVVSLTVPRGALHLKVTDDGHGFSQETSSPGFGLAGIRERMARHGGQVAIATSAAGTVVRITLPRKADS